MNNFSVARRENGDFDVTTMQPFEAIDPMLEAWGQYYGDGSGEVRELPENARAPDIHPLAVAIRHAPGTRAEAAARHIHRGGVERRKLMGVAAGVSIVPASFVDPVRCVESERVGRNAGQDPRYTATVRAVQAAWLDLQRNNPLLGTVVLVQYQMRGLTQADKAEIVAGKVGIVVGLKRYRDELRNAKMWLAGRLAA